MSPELIGLLALEILKLINHIIEGIPVNERQKWWLDNQKFWNELFQKLGAGEFKLPELKLPIVPKP